MTLILDRLAALFMARFGGVPDLVARAPGRVNLIGEHTDYNDGFVLPIAIDRATYVAARRRDDAMINVVAGDLDGAAAHFAIDAAILPDTVSPWSNYVRGVAAGLIAHGVALPGADLVVIGDVPQGAGLSSSASLEVATGHALAQLSGASIDRTTLALIGQKAEHDYAGCQCGVMDQLVSARGETGHALLVDCRSLETRPIPLADDVAIMIVPSGQTRGLVDGEYNLRRAQCTTAAAHYGVRALRDLDLARLEAGRGGLSDITDCRARHVVSENARTLAAAKCLESGDLEQLGRLMAASHDSMRDDFNITTPVIDGLVRLLQASIGAEGGARMTGGGFGGAVVAIMSQSIADRVENDIRTRYVSPSGMPVVPARVAASGGVSLI